MGVIKTQSLKSTGVNLLGTGIGVLTILFVVPADKELYGYIQWLHGTAWLLVSLLGLGLPTVVVKYYPEYEKRGQGGRFLPFVLLFSLAILSLLALILLVLNYLGFFEWLEGYWELTLFRKEGAALLLLAALLLYVHLFTFYASTQGKTVFPDLLNNLGFKIFLPLLFLAVYGQYFPLDGVPKALNLFFLILLLLLFQYSRKIGPKLLWPSAWVLGRAHRKAFFHYLGFTSFNNIAHWLSFRLDIIMLGVLLEDNFKSVGIYSILVVMANVLHVPMMAIARIAGPVIAREWTHGKREKIQEIYQKSALHLSMSGFVIFGLIFLGLPDLVRIMPGGLDLPLALSLFICLGLAKLVDSLSGLNTQVIVYSKNYTANLYFLVFQAVLNVVLNYFLILKYGVLGAALASFFAVFSYNLLKYLFIRFRYGMDFVSPQLVGSIGIGIGTVLLFYFFPEWKNPWISLGIRLSLFLLVISILFYYFKISPEANTLVKKKWLEWLT
jgi:O-antigen/teichoic acid export membrane protein